MTICVDLIGTDLLDRHCPLMLTDKNEFLFYLFHLSA